MMRHLHLLVATALLAASCGKSDTPAPVAKATSTGSGSGSAVAKKPEPQVKSAAKTKKPPPTKEQKAEYKKHMKAGWALQGQKKWAEAVPEFDAALVAIPGEPRALTESGWSAMNAGDYAKARTMNEQAIAVAIDKNVKAAGYYNLGLVQEKTGDKEGALKSYVASLALRPNPTVMAAVKKLGAKPDEPPPMCAAGQKACECIEQNTVGVFPDAKCAESKETPPAKGFKMYEITNPGSDSAAYSFLFDDKDQFVAQLSSDNEHGRHYEHMTLDKLEVKTVGQHQVLWIQTTDNDSATWPTEDGMDTEDLARTAVTICVLGDKTPRCPLRDVPLSERSTTDHIADDEGKKVQPGTTKETKLDVRLADDGTVTIELKSGPSDDQIQHLVGPHKLW